MVLHPLLHENIEAWVERDRDFLALVYGAQGLTYGQLWDQSGAIAATLGAQGLQPDDRVGILLERSPAAIVAMVGILRQGGAYVPLDPQWPVTRLHRAIADAQPRAIVTTPQLSHLLPTKVTVLHWDAVLKLDRDPLDQEPLDREPCKSVALAAQDPADRVSQGSSPRTDAAAGSLTPDALTFTALAPESLQPDSLQPDSLQPDSLQPDSLQPDSLQPDSLQPDSLQPNSLQPDSLQPDSLQPDAPNPLNLDRLAPDPLNPNPLSLDPLTPDPSNPDALNPDALNPDALNPDALNPDTLRPGALNPDNLAYVLYTSGSTGEPKGVAIAHRQVVGFLRGFEQMAPGGMRPVGTALCPFTFDVAVWEVFAVLGAGGTVHVLEPTAVAIAADLVAYWRSHRITNAYVPPGLIAGVVAVVVADPGALALRRLLVGVEPIPQGILQTLQQHLPELVILNGYGPTETTVCATLHRVTTTPQILGTQAHAPTPIGRAIPGYGVRLLDEHRQPVPVGQVGEIWIGGVGVARGYLHRPEQTAAAFVPLPDPHSGSVQRFYRTGDLARQQPDGTLVFVGRQDRQVKIRGFRIELGEVEAAIALHSQVAAVTVVTRANRLGDRTLAAYVILADAPSSPAPVTPPSSPPVRRDPAAMAALQTLQQNLRGQLPSYMQPNAWAVLTHFPRTAHGKIDVRQLPPPEALPATAPMRSPTTPIEEAIVGVWQALLGRADFGVDDHPFDWGGHSLMAAMAIAQLRDLLGVQLTLADALRYPTPSALATWITEQPRPDRPLAPPVPRDRPHPLSQTQEQFWIREQLALELDPSTASASHITVSFRVQGPLDRAAMGQSLTQLVARHESLRTHIQVNEQGIPMQVIAPPPPSVPFSIVTLPDEPPRLAAWATTFAEPPFDLAHDLPLRVAFIDLEPSQDRKQDWGEEWDAEWDAESVLGRDTLIVLTVHHLMADGWSVTGPLLGDWAALYAAARGERVPLPPLPYQFVDYAVLQSRIEAELGAERGAGSRSGPRSGPRSRPEPPALTYWRDRLAGSPAAATLWSAEATAATQARAGETQTFRVPAATTQRLREIAQQEGVSLFGVLQAAFAVLVGRAADCEDFTVGIPLADRDRPEWQNTVGLFLHTIVMRYDLSDNLPFGQWLRQVQTDWMAACQWPGIPFATLEGERPSPNRHPWFRTLLVFNPFAAPQLPLLGLHVTYQPVPKRSVLFDLTLNLWDDGGAELVGEWEYALDGVDAPLMGQLTKVWLTLLAAIATDPSQPVWSLPWLAPEDRDPAIAALTPATPPRPLDPIAAITQQATKHPDALALQAGTQTWTYRELHRQTNQLARYLRRVGVGRDTCVGIVLERSGQAILTMLAVLKAGGAYVPLDPTLPDTRIQAILEDARITALVTRSPWLDRLEQLCQGLTLPPVRITWERDATVVLTESDHDLPPVADAQRLAYVIYTSGTTGQPKGVAIERRSLAYFTTAAITTYGLTAQDRVLQFATLTFDAAVEEIYPTLSVGGTVVIRPEDFVGDSAQAMAWLQEAGITVLDVPTAYWHRWVAAVRSGDCALPPALRLVIIGGEAARPDVVRDWLQLGDRPALINTYGPTETTVVALTYPITAADVPSVDHPDLQLPPVPIGWPFVHVGVIALDRYRQPVPPGIAGELYLSGPALARGYLNRPEVTAAAFGALGWSRERLYRTGDRVRQRHDGAWVFLGRRDAQVKVRGFRVELMEIEAVLTRHPSVRAALVVMHPRPTGEPRLVAYLVTTLRPDRLPCHLSYRATLAQHTWHGITEDWALGGVGLNGVPVPLSLGSAIILTFAPPGIEDHDAAALDARDWAAVGLDAPLTLIGEVAWVQGPRAGVRWTADCDRSAIARVLQHQQQRIHLDRTVQRLVNRELRDFLVTHLPVYAVPSVLIPVSALPLTRHGKVDRAALPDPDDSDPASEETSLTPPCTPLERQLATCWRQLLGVSQIDRESNFFELGGHSLLAMQVITQAGKLVGHPIAIAHLYQAPTLGAFCDRLTALHLPDPDPPSASPPDPAIPQHSPPDYRTPTLPTQNRSGLPPTPSHRSKGSGNKGPQGDPSGEPGGSTLGNPGQSVDHGLAHPQPIAAPWTQTTLPDILVPIRAAGSQAPVFCLHLLGRNLDYFQPLAAHLRCDRPLLGLSLAFSPSLTSLTEPPWNSLRAIAATYVATLQTVQPQGPYYLMGYSFGGLIAYEVAQQLQAQGHTVAQVILLDTSISPTAVALPWPERWLVRWRLYRHQRRVWRQPWPVRWRRYGQRVQGWANRVMVFLRPQDPAVVPAAGEAMGDRPLGTFTAQGIRLEDHSWVLSRPYIAQPYQGAIVLIRSQRPMNSLRDYNLHRDPTLGWGPVAGPNLEIRTVPGDHVSMLRPHHAAALAAVLDDYLTPPAAVPPSPPVAD